MKKLISIRLDLELLDELIEIENDRRMIAAELNNLKYVAYNRTTFLEALIKERKRYFEREGEM